MKITDFELYKDIVRERSGIVLTQEKSYLIESRLGPIAKKWGFDSLDSMTMNLHGVPDINLLRDIAFAMTTPDTAFFRVPHHYEEFEKTFFPYFIANRTKRTPVRIWSAGCSSGQEAYSFAILLKEMAEKNSETRKVEIYATDLSRDLLKKAKEGVFTQFEMQRGMPIDLVMKYFDQKQNRWQLKKELRKMVAFDRFNLIKPMKKLNMMDVILCRDVLPYFGVDTRKQVIEGLCEKLRPDGIMILDHPKSAQNADCLLKPIDGKPGFFALEGSVHHLS